MLRIEITRGNDFKGQARYKFDVTLNYHRVASGEVLTPEKKLDWRGILKAIADSDSKKDKLWTERNTREV